MRIAMLVPGLARHDAISNDALGMSRALRAAGHEVALFAQHASGVDEEIASPERLRAWVRDRRDVLVYHLCTGWDFAVDLLRDTPARRVVRHHNITPPEFFVGWSDGYVEACRNGRAQLDAIAALGCELYLGDSSYNNEDFLSRGVSATRCATLAPFHEIEQLASLTADARRIPAASDLWLMVGRISPNKGHLDLVDAFAAHVNGGATDARLLVIGKLDPNLARYGEAMTTRIERHGLGERVVWLQDANGAELRAAFERASALVMLSRHEGFCVPVIEAMALGTPVVALGSSALTETVGDAGLVWDSADPHLIAASCARLASDATVQTRLRVRGLARYREHYAPSALTARLHATFERLAA